MAFTPLTKEQYQKALDSGFTPDKIIEFEKRRQSESQAPSQVGLANQLFNRTGTLDMIKANVKKFATLPTFQRGQNLKPEDISSVAGIALGVTGEAEALKSVAGKLIPSTVAEKYGPEIAKKLEAPGLLMKGLQKVAAPFVESFDRKAAQQFQQAGIKAPVSALSKAPAVTQIESLAAKGLFGRAIYENIQATKEFLANKTEELVNALRPEKISQEALGTTVKNGVQEFETKFRTAQKQIYESFLAKAKDTEAVTTDTESAINKIIQEQNKTLTGEKDKIYQTIRDKINIPRKLGGGKGIVFEPRTNLTFENLKATRTDIGSRLAKNPRDPFLNQLYKAITSDMDATVIAKDAELGPQLKSISEGYKNGIRQVQSNLAQSIGKMNPENIGSVLAKRNSAAAFKQLRTIIGAENFQDVSNSILTKVMEGSTTRGVFDVQKFSKNLAKYDPQVLAEIFSAEQLALIKKTSEELQKVGNLQELMKPATKVREGSQTAFLVQTGALGGAASTMIGALLTGNFALAGSTLLLAAGDIGSQYGFSKLVTSPIGRKYLTEGFDISGAIKALQNQSNTIRKGARIGESLLLQNSSPNTPNNSPGQ